MMITNDVILLDENHRTFTESTRMMMRIIFKKMEQLF